MRAASSTATRQATIGLGLSAAIIAAWLMIHVSGVHFLQLSDIVDLAWALPLAAIQCWLSVGLFIISHDAIHGSLVPGQPRVNRAMGWLTMTLYAGFNYDRMAAAHHQHHAAPGTAEDPDFSVQHPRAFWPWFAEFFGRYFGWRPLIFVNAVVVVYWLILGAPMANIFVFYGLPALCSAAQLFYFGTYRTHRHESGSGFADHHNARSTPFGWLGSLASCYHFGYHHEHHLFPHEPWWRLPARHAEQRGARDLVA